MIPNSTAIDLSIRRCGIAPWRRGPIWPPTMTPGIVQQTGFHGTAPGPPPAISADTCANEALATVTITIRTEVAAATGTGIRFRRTNCGMTVSPIPTETMPVRKPPSAVPAAPKP